MAKIIKKTWTFESSSGSKTYQTLQYMDGTTSCNCFGWTRHVYPDGSRNCKHTRAVDMNRADTECLAMKDYSQTVASLKKIQTPKAPKSKSQEDLTPVVRKIQWK